MREQPGWGGDGESPLILAPVSQRPCSRVGEEMISRPPWLQETFCLGRPEGAEPPPYLGQRRPRYRHSGVWR